MKRRGFTLIELLAVIVILAIIALIAVPIILNVVEDSKKGALKATAYNIISAGELDFANGELNNNDSDKYYDLSTNDLKYKGKVDDGALYVSKKGLTSIAVKKDGFCAVKRTDEVEVRIVSVTDSDCDLSIVKPQIPIDNCFNVNNNTIVSYDFNNQNCPLNIVINEQINGQTILNIGDNAFNRDGLSRKLVGLKLPKTIQKIGINAFATNSIGELDLSMLSQLKSIGNYAFYKNQLSDLDLSGAKNLETIGSYTFYFNKIKRVNFSGLNKLTLIDTVAFNSNQIEELDFTGVTSLTTFGDHSFRRNRIKNLDLLPLTGLKSTGIYSFYENEIVNLKVSGMNSLNEFSNNSFTYNQIENLDLRNLPNVKSIDGFNWNNIKNLDLSVLTNLENIDGYAFHHNPMTSVNLNGLNKLLTIKEYAFRETRLPSVEIPASVTSIGLSAFYLETGYNWSNVTIKGVSTRFNADWTNIGWPTNLKP